MGAGLQDCLPGLNIVGELAPTGHLISCIRSLPRLLASLFELWLNLILFN
jgi:hypothetical protein